MIRSRRDVGIVITRHDLTCGIALFTFTIAGRGIADLRSRCGIGKTTHSRATHTSLARRTLWTIGFRETFDAIPQAVADLAIAVGTSRSGGFDRGRALGRIARWHRAIVSRRRAIAVEQTSDLSRRTAARLRTAPFTGNVLAVYAGNGFATDSGGKNGERKKRN